MCPSFLKQLIGAVDELEAAMNGDVTCAVSFIRGQGVYASKFQKLSWKLQGS